MATNYTPLLSTTVASAPAFNTPLQELDDEIEDIKDGTAALSAPQISSFASSEHDHTDAAGGGLIPFDSLDTGASTAGQYFASDGAGGGSWVTEAKWAIGDLLAKARVSDASNTWLRADGRTIGAATSGATARANADMQNLFTHLWTEFTNTELVIQDSAGAPTTRGASAAADFGAHKRLPLIDLRGRVIAGMDSPAGAAANRVTSAQADILGGVMGSETQTLTTANLAAHQHQLNYYNAGGTAQAVTVSGYTFGNNQQFQMSYNSPNTTSNNMYMGNQGSGTAHNNMQPALFLNYFIYTGN